jgi:single-stranded-DNA-specific exonuclease
MKKDNIKILDNFIQNDYIKKISKTKNINRYDMELSASALKTKFMNDINKLGPFGNFNSLPTFLIKNVNIVKFRIINNKHISATIKPTIGPSIKAISFNCLNTKIGEYLLTNKKIINIVGQIHENIWNNKKTIQFNIKDIIL